MSNEDTTIRLPVMFLVGDRSPADTRALVVRTQARELAETAEELAHDVMKGLVKDGVLPSQLGTCEGAKPGVTLVVVRRVGKPPLPVFAVIMEGEIGLEPVTIRGKWLEDRETLVGKDSA